MTEHDKLIAAKIQEQLMAAIAAGVPVNTGEFKPVRLADILVPAYQRDGDERSAKDVTNNFDPQLLQAITLVQVDEMDEDDRYLLDEEGDNYHRSGELYVLVDGLQRCTGLAAKHKVEGNAQVMAQVFTDVARDRQVDLFVGLNRGSVRVRDYWIYLAKLKSGHPGVNRINQVLVAAGFQIARDAGKSKVGSGRIVSVGSLTEFCGVKLSESERTEATPASVQALSDALAVINAVWPVGQTYTYQRTNAGILFGLATAFRDARSRGRTPLAGQVEYVVGQIRSFGSGNLSPGGMINEAASLKDMASKKEGFASGGSASRVKFAAAAWLHVINKGTKLKYSIAPSVRPVSLPTAAEE